MSNYKTEGMGMGTHPSDKGQLKGTDIPVDKGNVGGGSWHQEGMGTNEHSVPKPALHGNKSEKEQHSNTPVNKEGFGNPSRDLTTDGRWRL